jgi:hypothetical protein
MVDLVPLMVLGVLALALMATGCGTVRVPMAHDQLSYGGFAIAAVSKIRVRTILTSGETKVWSASSSRPSSGRVRGSSTSTS